MDGPGGALATTAGGLLCAAVALAHAGRRQRTYRGWIWWVTAMLAGASGALLAAQVGDRDHVDFAAPLGQALLLCWPVAVLAALRRFHARQGLPGEGRTDLMVLLLAQVVQPWLPGPAVLGLHLYVAALAWGARPDEDGGPLRLVGAAVALAALPVALSRWTGDAGTVVAHALGSGPALLVCAFAALSAMTDRTERELRLSRRRLRVMANTDPLTGVANRRHFEDSALRLLRTPAPEPPVLLLLDIDHFKLINDRLGHPAGDRALRLVGRCIQEALRAGDLAARLGGDEFALVLCGATLPQAMGVAERVVEQLQAQSPDHRLPMLSLSFGMVQMRTDEPLDEALHRADRALYEAKRQGRSRAVASHGDEAEPAFSESQRLGLTPY